MSRLIYGSFPYPGEGVMRARIAKGAQQIEMFPPPFLPRNDDLTYFENKIPDSVATAHFQPAEPLMTAPDKIKPLLESQWWLWSVMVLTISGLGLFTVKMMRQKPQAKAE